MKLIENRDLTCHEEAVLVKVHSGEASGKENKEAITGKCLSCHGSYAALIELTADSAAFVDVNGNVINPHQTHQGEVDCYQCHQMHFQYDPINYCTACHHNGLANCNTCHED